ncbi:type I pullulanase [Oceanivirga salmonicida]|uniref:type I pullulanase n=1 Tax=Oceanivirga salmonicida TaxID=1769291 RepID=UPI0012E0D0A8|nr:type I pullulanase [Oceanivirga salmonicida]
MKRILKNKKAYFLIAFIFISIFLALFKLKNKQSDSEIVLVPEANKTKIIIHYQNPVDKEWDLWIWAKGFDGRAYEFDASDKFGQVANITLDGEYESVGYIVRKSDWSQKDVPEDRYIDIKNGVAQIWLKTNDANTYYENPDNRPESFDKLTAKVYYNRLDKDYENWKILVNDKVFDFKKDEFGAVSNIEVTGTDIKEINFLIFKGMKDNMEQKDTNVRKIEKFNNAGESTVYVVAGIEKPYASREEALEKREIMSAKIDTLNSLTIKTNKPFNLNEITKNDISVNNMEVESINIVNGTREQTDKIEVIFTDKFDLTNKNNVHFKDFGTKEIVIGKVLQTEEFDKLFATDEELGPIYSKEKTVFKVWAPTAKNLNLLVFNGNKKETISMKKNKKGVYSVTLKGDKLGLEYLYEVHLADKINVTVDPYAKSTTINGGHSVVVNPLKLDSKFIKTNTPIIYELNIRDVSSYKDSGIKNRGKFLGLTEKNTKTSKGQITGLDYIKSLGVTYLQLMPIYDFSEKSVDEKDQFSKYNWGYDPVNYNTVEGSYSTNPNDPNNRIVELQKLVKVLHENNLGVIMDVVYNHVFSAREHAFDLIVPGYFFRIDENGNLTNGTGVGNDIASERKMARKYIVDSLKYWMNTYKIDGFRFDLMGILDINTMKEVYTELKKINPNVLLLGEGWNMGTLDPDLRANQHNANKIPEIAFFNDDIRNSVKGSTFGVIGQGFVSGKEGLEKYVVKNIKGGKGIKTYTKPGQLIQYVEAHDNLTLWDQLKKTNGADDDKILVKRHQLATTIIMLSNGIPFIHAGQEYLRTKNGDENSYKSPDSVNMMDWNRALENKENVNYVKELIAIRKKYSNFNMQDFETIDKNFKVLKDEDFIIAYTLNGNDFIYVIYNANKESKEINIPNGQYTVLVKDGKANSKGIENIKISDGKIKINGISSLVLVVKK